MTTKTIAHRPWPINGRIGVFYVANLKRAVGDWGYTTRADQAIHLSPYWQRRFAADCSAVGDTATFIEVATETTP